MKISRNSASLLLVTMAAGAAYAQQPPDPVQSDSRENTAVGTSALLKLQVTESGGLQNTALGFAALGANVSGIQNAAGGSSALQFNTSGSYNTAFGSDALFSNTTGSTNTAVGIESLYSNVSGVQNSAFGAFSLYKNTTGAGNTACGIAALEDNTTGSGNTASGANALMNNGVGASNSSSGYESLYSNTTGSNNTAEGYTALYSNTTGASNTASGNHALYFNTTGYHGTGGGAETLFSNTTGNTNVGYGFEALYHNTTGSNNTAVGPSAGFNLTTGSNNVDIANEGFAGESGIIRIGAPSTQTQTFIAGIENSKVTGSAVYVTAGGQLGVLASSERYKTAIAPMGDDTDKLSLLRPVVFHLKTEPSGQLQYGLIAEEVARVYPALVIRNEAGTIEGVRYDELAPMLLNQVQKQQQRLEKQAELLRAQAAALDKMRGQVAEVLERAQR
ncbi:MAG TPA: tail fiber domain-containing protein [Steroidobacteraceae bacterium]|jgi:hypothetical protein|nr:tail fiber domain-containing protein [Steroidobacteraceae bacterium]